MNTINFANWVFFSPQFIFYFYDFLRNTNTYIVKCLYVQIFSLFKGKRFTSTKYLRQIITNSFLRISMVDKKIFIPWGIILKIWNSNDQWLYFKIYNPIRNANLATSFFHTATKLAKMFLSLRYKRLLYITGGCENYSIFL